MDGHLNSVSRPVRWLAIAALVLATPLFAALVVLLATLPLRKPGFIAEDLVKLAAIVAFLAALMLASGWMLARLLRGAVSSNGVTMMPAWFVRVGGVAFVAGSGWMACVGGMPPLVLAELAAIGFSMVFLARYLESEEFRPIEPVPTPAANRDSL